MEHVSKPDKLQLKYLQCRGNENPNTGGPTSTIVPQPGSEAPARLIGTDVFQPSLRSTTTPVREGTPANNQANSASGMNTSFTIHMSGDENEGNDNQQDQGGPQDGGNEDFRTLCSAPWHPGEI